MTSQYTQIHLRTRRQFQLLPGTIYHSKTVIARTADDYTIDFDMISLDAYQFKNDPIDTIQKRAVQYGQLI